MLYATDTTDDRSLATVVDAATLLGITPDAVRARLRHGTLHKQIGLDGETLVVLDADTTATGQPTEQPTVANINALKSYADELKDQVSFLRAQLVNRDQELAEMRRLLAGASERVPELEPAPEPRESPPEGSEEPGK